MKYRTPLVVVLLPFVTFGVYNFYWFIVNSEDLRLKGYNLRSFLVAFFLGIITLGIYWLYWDYKFIKTTNFIKYQQLVV